MRRLHKYIVLIFLVVLTLPFYSQDNTPKIKRVMLVKTSPDFTFQINANYNQAMGQLSGTFNDDFQSDQFIQGKSLGADKGLGLNATGKLKLDHMGHFRFIFSGQYNKISSYFFGKKTGVADVGKSNFNILSTGAGFENNFTPNHRVKIFLGAEALVSWINGKATIWVENRGGEPYKYDLDILTSFRLGGVIHGGAEYSINNTTALNLGFNITHANLLLRNSGNNDNNLYEIPLIDDDPDSPGTYAGKKNFTFLTISAGVSFYFGVYEKRYLLTK
ncbi:MAG: hypothetical protein EHM58_06920 [Ignavibacteriae bacterium]|nr:MAG: hypothetical protein EHM58_06920 [Ignavibacteriota bacterium]